MTLLPNVHVREGSWGKGKISMWNIAMTLMPLQESCPGQTYKA